MAVSDSARSSLSSAHSHPWLAEALFALDVRLRRRHAVIEYTPHPSCVFRVGIVRTRRPLAFRNGTLVQAGERIAQLHFWNEHVPPVPEQGATIAWARKMQQCIAISLRELALYLSSHRDLDDIVAICAEVPSATMSQCRQLARVMAYYGFEASTEQERLPLGERIHRFAENILISLTVFAQNAKALRLDTLRRVRLPIFISRQALDKRFGGAEPPVAP